MKPTQRQPKLHEQIAHELQQHIHTRCKSGDRLESIRDLSRKLGVSAVTLRAAQAILCRDGLLDARHGSGVYVSQRTDLRRVGILIEQNILHRRISRFFVDVTDALRRYFRANDVRVRLYIGATDPGEIIAEPSCWDLIEDLKGKRLDGLVTIGTDPHPSWKDLLDQSHVPAVGVSGQIGLTTRIGTDFGEMYRCGVKQLHDQGCRRIALLNWSNSDSLKTFRAAMNELGLVTREKWIFGDINPNLCGAGWEGVREIWFAYPDRPDGLLVCDDILFSEAKVAIQELGIQVPGQLKVVTHANKGSGMHYPFPVTLLENDPDAIALGIGEMMLRLINGKTVSEPKTSMPFKVIQMKPEGVRQQSVPNASSNGIAESLDVIHNKEDR